MARQTFTWHPTTDWTEDKQPSVDVIKFGDGYEQRIAKGINGAPAVFNLEFVTTPSEIIAIRTFLETHGGVDSFDWTNPLSETGIFIARKWRVMRNDGATLKLTTTFEQVYE